MGFVFYGPFICCSIKGLDKPAGTGSGRNWTGMDSVNRLRPTNPSYRRTCDPLRWLICWAYVAEFTISWSHWIIFDYDQTQIFPFTNIFFKLYITGYPPFGPGKMSLYGGLLTDIRVRHKAITWTKTMVLANRPWREFNLSKWNKKNCLLRIYL